MTTDHDPPTEELNLGDHPPTQELSWFTLFEHKPRHEDAREEAPDPAEELRRHEDVVDADDVSVRSAAQRRRRPRRPFRPRGH